MNNHLSFYVIYRLIGAFWLKKYSINGARIKNVLYIVLFRYIFIIVFLSLFSETNNTILS